MKRVGLYIVMAVSVVYLSGCDKIEGDHFEKNAATDTNYTFPEDTTTAVYRVLVEDYTGHTCGNCPNAARELYNNIKPTYGDRLITLGVHADFFAETVPPHTPPKGSPPGSYSANYNTQAGTDWYNFFQLYSNPLALVSRKDFPAGNHIKTLGAWGTEIASIINRTPRVKIRIHNSYNASTRELKTYSETKFLEQGNSTYKLNVLLAEDSIVSWQEDYAAPDTNVANYVHRHVLRGSINGSFGAKVNTDVTTGAGTKVFKGYVTTLPDDWNVNHMNVIVFLYDDATKEILNVAEAEIIE